MRIRSNAPNTGLTAAHPVHEKKATRDSDCCQCVSAESAAQHGCAERGRPPPGGDGGRRGVRLRGGRAEPAQRSRGVQPPRVKNGSWLEPDMKPYREHKHA